MAPDGPRLSRASQAARIAQRTPRIGKTITFLHSRGPGWQGARSGLHDGKVTGNLRFGDWYSNTGSGITADGKQIAPWAIAVAASSKTWPAKNCAPRPG